MCCVWKKWRNKDRWHIVTMLQKYKMPSESCWGLCYVLWPLVWMWFWILQRGATSLQVQAPLLHWQICSWSFTATLLIVRFAKDFYTFKINTKMFRAWPSCDISLSLTKTMKEKKVTKKYNHTYIYLLPGPTKDY